MAIICCFSLIAICFSLSKVHNEGFNEIYYVKFNMQIISTIVSKIRMPLWWYHLVPPIAGVVYAVLYMGDIPVEKLAMDIMLFTISIIGTAGFGYWLNDWTDLASDIKAGKPNYTKGLGWQQKSAVLILLFTTSWLPWLFLPTHLISLSALILLYFCFFVYSVPPFRFKNRAFLGVLCDIHYGHVLPVVIALSTFVPLWLPQRPVESSILILLMLLLYLKGFRNIIEHQLSDRKNDRLNGINTFVMSIGPLKAAKIIGFVLVPLELLVIAILLLQWSQELFIAYFLFLALYIFLLYRWGVFHLSRRYHYLSFRYVANDFYESFFPLSVLLILCFRNLDYIIILLLHSVVFSKNFKLFKWIAIEIKAIFNATHPQHLIK